MKIGSNSPPRRLPPTEVNTTAKKKDTGASTSSPKPTSTNTQQGPTLAELRKERAQANQLPTFRRSVPDVLANRLNRMILPDSGSAGGVSGPSRPIPDAPITPETQTAQNPAGPSQQQWQNTCGPNTLMAMEAAVDPQRAQELQSVSNPEQRSALEASVFSSSPNFTGVSPNPRAPGSDNAGWGKWEMINQINDRFEGSAQSMDPANRTEAVDGMVTALQEGKPVAVGLPEHWVSATDIRQGENGNEILMHDSWSGESQWVPESSLRDTSSNWMSEHFSDAPFASNIATLVYPETPQLSGDSTFRGNESTQ